MDINEGGIVTFDEAVECNRARIKASYQASEIKIVEVVSHYQVKDRLPAPDTLITSEMQHQMDLSEPVFWWSRGDNLLLNRATGAIVSATISEITGPDGNTDSAMQFTSSLNLGSVALVAGTLLFWHQNVASVRIGGTNVELGTVGTSGLWTLAYATGITASGALVFSASGAGKVFDIRGYNATIGANARSYLLKDITQGTGDRTMDAY